MSGNFERFQYFNFETDFLENENRFQKNWSADFEVQELKLKTYHFQTKLPYQKQIIRQIEWWVQNGPITKNQIPIFLLFVKAGVLFDGNFSLSVSLNRTRIPKEEVPAVKKKPQQLVLPYLETISLQTRTKL